MPKRRPHPPAADGLADALAAMAAGESGGAADEFDPPDDRDASSEPSPDASPLAPDRPAAPVAPVKSRRAARPAVEAIQPSKAADQPVLAPPPTPQVRRAVARRGEKPARKTSASKPARRRAANPNLDFQRTIIPVCLTLGVLLPLFGLYWLLNGEDSPVRLLPGWLPAGLTAVGAVLGLLGVATMLRVGRAMRE